MSLEFHTLTISDVDRLTDEAVAVTFDVPTELGDEFRYLPGQHVTVRAMIDGADVRRSYSICANANDGTIRVGVKQIPNGVFSTWANTVLQAGMELDVMPPVGDFTLSPDPSTGRHYGAIAAGSGITPVLSLISSVLQTEADSRFTLVFGNRTTSSTMFLEELAAIKDTYPERFQMIHVFSREPQVVELFHGRIDAEKLDSLFDTLVPVASIDEWFLCGPAGLVHTARAVLVDRDVVASAIHDELFFDDEIPELPPPEDPTSGSTVTFTLDGRSSVVVVDPDGQPILDHALQVRRELPFSCKGGVCATCKARLVEGEVEMDQNWALVEEEVDAGFILACQAHPTSDAVVLDFDV